MCPICYRWNLVPIEERWEAVESCERLFGASQQRVSTGQIGLAYHRSGLSLVRIGSPDSEDELAYWRFGQMVRSRARRSMFIGGVGAILATAGAFGTLAGVAALGGLSGVVNLGFMFGMTRPVTRVRVSEKKTRLLRRAHIGALRVVHRAPGEFDTWVRDGSGDIAVTDDQLAHVLLRSLPHLNRDGSPEELRMAREALHAAPSPDHFVRSVLSDPNWMRRALKKPRAASGKTAGYVVQMPRHLRLAVEMALNTERESAAMRGELRVLEIAWREAEELARISDNLLPPQGWTRLLERAGRLSGGPS